MATKIYKRTMLNGREIMVKFGYADNNGEYYTRFADASHHNGGRGASYAAFIAYPADIPCWEMDEEYGFEDRALESWEKSDFVEDYLRSHPSKEAFDFMVDVQDELKRRSKDIGATVGGFDEGCDIFIKSERDRQLVCVHISFCEDGDITVMGCYNNHDVYLTHLEWSDTKWVIDEAMAAFDGLCQYRDNIHLPKMKGGMVSMDTLKCEFNHRVYEMMKESISEYVEYVRGCK